MFFGTNFFFLRELLRLQMGPWERKIPLRLLSRKQLYDALQTRPQYPSLFGHMTFILIARGKREPYVLFSYAYQIF